MRTGVFICQVASGDATALTTALLRHMPPTFRRGVGQGPGVLPSLDPRALSAEFARDRLERVVVAGDSPGFFKPAFTKAMMLAGETRPRSGWPPSGARRVFGHGHGQGQVDRSVCCPRVPFRWQLCRTPPPLILGR